MNVSPLKRKLLYSVVITLLEFVRVKSSVSKNIYNSFFGLNISSTMFSFLNYYPTTVGGTLSIKEGTCIVINEVSGFEDGG